MAASVGTFPERRGELQTKNEAEQGPRLNKREKEKASHSNDAISASGPPLDPLWPKDQHGLQTEVMSQYSPFIFLFLTYSVSD